MPTPSKKDAFQTAGAKIVSRNSSFTSPVAVNLADVPRATTTATAAVSAPTPAPGLVPPPPPPTGTPTNYYQQGYDYGLAHPQGPPPPAANAETLRGYTDALATLAPVAPAGHAQLGANQVSIDGRVYTVNADGSYMYDAAGNRYAVPDTVHLATAPVITADMPMFRDGVPVNDAAFAITDPTALPPDEASDEGAAVNEVMNGSGEEPLPTADDLPTVDELTQQQLAENPADGSYATPRRAALVPSPPMPEAPSRWPLVLLGAYLLKRFVF